MVLFAPPPHSRRRGKLQGRKNRSRKSENPKYSPTPMRRKQHNSLDVLPAMFEWWKSFAALLYTFYTGRSVRMRPRTATEPCVSSIRRCWQHWLVTFTSRTTPPREENGSRGAPSGSVLQDPAWTRRNWNWLQLIHYDSTYALLGVREVCRCLHAERGRPHFFAAASGSLCI